MFNYTHTWEFFLWLWAGAEGGFPPVRAASVINKSNSQTRRTSERIFFPGELSRPVRLDVLRVLGLRPFMLQKGYCSLSLSTLECKWQKLNAESQRSRLAKIHDLHTLIPSWVLFHRIQFRYWRQWRVDGQIHFRRYIKRFSKKTFALGSNQNQSLLRLTESVIFWEWNVVYYVQMN